MDKASFIVLLLLATLFTSIAQDYGSVRSTLSIPIGTIFPGCDSESESVFKYIINQYNTRAPTDGYDPQYPDLPVVRFQAFLQNSPRNESYSLMREFCNHVAQGVFVIMGSVGDETKVVAESYSSSFQIPWITTSVAIGTNSRFMTSIFPSLSRPVLALMRNWKCKHFTYFYDRNEVQLSLRDILDFSNAYDITVKVRNIDGKQNILPHLKGIILSDEHVIVFDVIKNTSLNALRQLDDIGMLTNEYQYIFTDLTLKETDLLKFTSGDANITLLSIVKEDSMEFRIFQDRYRQENENNDKITYEGALMYDAFTTLSIAIKAALMEGYNLQYQIEAMKSREQKVKCHEPPISVLEIGPQITKYIKKVRFNGLTSRVQFNDFGQRINYTVNLLSLGRVGIRTIGYWVDEDVGGAGVGSITIDGRFDHKKALEIYMNRTIVVTTILEEPYAMLKKDWQNYEGNERYEGFCVDLLKELNERVPGKYKLRPVLDGNYGSMDETTGMWNGMIGEVKYNKAHIAVAPLTITSEREAAVDFTKPFMSLGISIMIKKPEREKPHIFSFLEPLATEIWICIVFAYMGVSVVLFFVSRFSPYEWHRESVLQDDSCNEEEVEPSADFGIFNTLWFSLGFLMQQGADISPKSFSGRVVGGIWWFFTLIIVSSYTANLAAFLTVDRMGSPIKGAQDLAEQSDIKYGILESGSTAGFFKHTPIALYQKMWNYMKNQDPSVFVQHNTEGIERVRNSNGKYAFLMESTLNDYMAQRKPCNTMKVGENVDSKGYGIAIPKGSPIFESINLAILTLRERGRLQKLKKFWWYDKSQCTESSQGKSDSTSALGLANVAGVFYLLLFGLILAVFMAIAEYCTHAAWITKEMKKKIKKKCIQKLPCMKKKSTPFKTSSGRRIYRTDHSWCQQGEENVKLKYTDFDY